MQSSDPDFIKSSLSSEDVHFEVPLRPQYLKDFSGQERLIDRLKIFIGAAKKRNETLGHALFNGPPGLGKTTLAGIIAKEMQANIVITSGPVIEKPGDLAGLLTNLKKGDILFIDEIHRLNRVVEEYLYPAMEDFVLDLLIDSGPHSRSVQVKLAQFTLIGSDNQNRIINRAITVSFCFIN